MPHKLIFEFVIFGLSWMMMQKEWNEMKKWMDSNNFHWIKSITSCIDNIKHQIGETVILNSIMIPSHETSIFSIVHHLLIYWLCFTRWNIELTINSNIKFQRICSN